MRVTRLLDVPHVEQHDDFDCGPAALAAALAFHGATVTLAELTPLADPERGTPPDVLVTEIRRRGLEVEFGSYSPRQLRQRSSPLDHISPRRASRRLPRSAPRLRSAEPR